MDPVATPKVEGPERPTLLERAIGFIPLPYVASCVLLALIFGNPGSILARYLDTGDINEAISGSPYAPPAASPIWLRLLVDTIWTLLMVYVLLSVRSMRLRVAAAKPALLPLLPRGEENFNRIFGPVSHSGPPAALAILLFVPFSLSIVVTFSRTTGPFESAFLAVSTGLTIFTYPTFLWVYFRSIRGAHVLGKEPLRLKPYHEDPMMGLRPLGLLSLSLALAHFVGLGLLTVAISLEPGASPPEAAILPVVLILLGILLFFLPLYRVHGMMVRERQRAQALARSQYTRLAQGQDNPGSDGSDTMMAEVRNILADLRDAFRLDMEDRRIAAIPTWPFDTRILGRLAVIVLSVMAILLARIITVRFGL